eukprot:gene9644-21270_t
MERRRSSGGAAPRVQMECEMEERRGSGGGVTPPVRRGGALRAALLVWVGLPLPRAGGVRRRREGGGAATLVAALP